MVNGLRPPGIGWGNAARLLECCAPQEGAFGHGLPGVSATGTAGGSCGLSVS
jgi:hypothetical protein